MPLIPPESPDVPLLSPPSALLTASGPVPFKLAGLDELLANYCVRGVPGWAQTSEQDVEITPMKKGMTNQLFIAQRKHRNEQNHQHQQQQHDDLSNNLPHNIIQSMTQQHLPSNNPSISTSSKQPDASPVSTYDKVVVRVFGHDTSTFFDREYEEYITRRLSRRGIGSRILTEFGSGRIEAFLEGRTLECDDLSDPRISYLCAKALGALHSKHIPINAQLIERTKLKVQQDADKLLPTDPIERERALSMSQMDVTDSMFANNPSDNSPTASTRQQFEQSVSLVASFDPFSTPSSPVPPAAHLNEQIKGGSIELPPASVQSELNSVDVSLNYSESYMEPLLYFRMRHWFSVARQLNFTDPVKQSIFESLNLMSDSMNTEVEWLCDKLISLDSPIVFCHNDLQEGNLILDTSAKPSRKRSSETISQPASNQSKHLPTLSAPSTVTCHHKDKPSLVIDISERPMTEAPLTSNVSFDSLHRVMSSPHSPISHRIQNDQNNQSADRDDHSVYGHWRLYMIDFEYSSYNPRGFDLANHLCEHGIDYNCSDWPGFIIHGFPPNVPSKTHTLRFLETYLTHFKRASRDDTPVTEQELQKITRETLWFTLASHFKWAMWGIVQAARSQIHFGYMEYAKQRMECYRLAKEQLLKWERDGPSDWPASSQE